MFGSGIHETRTFRQLGFTHFLDSYPAIKKGNYYDAREGHYTVDKDMPERYWTWIKADFRKLPQDARSKLMDIRQYNDPPDDWDFSLDIKTTPDILELTPHALYKKLDKENRKALLQFGVLDTRIPMDESTYKKLMYSAHILYPTPTPTVSWLKTIWDATDLELHLEGCMFPFMHNSTDYFNPRNFILCVWHPNYDINKTYDTDKLRDFFSLRMQRLSFIWPSFRLMNQPMVNHFNCTIDPTYTKQMSLKQLHKPLGLGGY